MKKKISLPVMAVAAILLLGGCGTVTGELINDEINSQSMLRLSYAAQ